jgi:serine/threonine protein kinase
MIETQRFLQGQVADGRFPLIEYLGGTDHSAVFLTEHADAENRRAAIKLIPAPPGTSEAQLTRWRIAAKFSHPHLLRLFEAGRCTLDNAEMLYVVMEYAEENLAEILSQRSLSPSETSELLAPVLDALGYLHGKGFVHGHIQPSNVMAIGDEVRLSSDGICRLGECERRTAQNRYSAPECAAGDLSSATDVWSLGMTLVECLTGHLPEAAEGNKGTVSLPVELPAPFLDLVRHCLHKTPQRRWGAVNLKARLERIPAAEVEEVTIPVPQETPAPAKRRYPLALKVGLAGLGLATAAILLGMVMIGSSSNAKRMRATETASQMGSPAEQPKAAAPAAERSASETHVPQSANGNSPRKEVREAAWCAAISFAARFPTCLASPATRFRARFAFGCARRSIRRAMSWAPTSILPGRAVILRDCR